jgi:hypothetical protein
VSQCAPRTCARTLRSFFLPQLEATIDRLLSYECSLLPPELLASNSSSLQSAMSYNAYGLLPYSSLLTTFPSPFDHFESPPVSDSQQSQLKLDNVWCEGDFTLVSAPEGRAEVHTLFRVRADELRSLR